MSGWKIIKPKKDPFTKRLAGAGGRVLAALSVFALDSQRELSDYPTAQASRYIRTGDLGQSWTTSGPSIQGNEIRAKVGNKRKYARIVQGSKQSELFKGKGWPNIVDVGKKTWSRHRPLVIKAIQG